jgi:hypothetical protein
LRRRRSQKEEREMAEGDGAIYNAFKMRVLKGEHDLTESSPNDIKVILVSGYTPNVDTDTDYDSGITGVEVSGTGYTAGGESLANQAVTQDDANDRGKFDADNVTWSSLQITDPSDGTPSHAIMYDDSHANKGLMAYWEVTTPTNGGDYTLAWHATDGIITLT